MAASVGTVSTYVLFMYSLRLHSLEYSTYMYTLAKANDKLLTIGLEGQ